MCESEIDLKLKIALLEKMILNDVSEKDKDYHKQALESYKEKLKTCCLKK